jgi:hypothetical protein
MKHTKEKSTMKKTYFKRSEIRFISCGKSGHMNNNCLWSPKNGGQAKTFHKFVCVCVCVYVCVCVFVCVAFLSLDLGWS